MFKQITDQNQWDSIVNGSKLNHPLQLWGWGEVKKINSWVPLRIVSEDGIFAAQILLKKLPKLNFYLAYVPRGPLCSAEQLQNYIEDLKKYLKTKNVLSLRLEPSYSEQEASALKLKSAKNRILMNQTLQIDLDQSIDIIKSKMNSSTKNNINKSLKDNTVVSWSEIDNFIDVFYQIYSDTASRAGFKIQKKEYYQAIIDNLKENIDIKVAIDNKINKPVCFLWNIFSDNITCELYAGISMSMPKNSKANYGLKFKAIEDAVSRGSLTYDFNGRLQGGVESFKKQFGPEEVDFTKALQLNINKFSQVLDLAEKVARKI